MARVNRRFYFSRRITSPWPTSWSLRSEEHTSELQSRLHLVCRLLLEKKNNADNIHDQMSSEFLLRINEEVIADELHDLRPHALKLLQLLNLDTAHHNPALRDTFTRHT